MPAQAPRHHCPLVSAFAHRFVAQRFALIGDVAVGMHPVTAHDYNFGLQGVQVLAMAERASSVSALIKSAITRTDWRPGQWPGRCR